MKWIKKRTQRFVLLLLVFSLVLPVTQAAAPAPESVTLLQIEVRPEPDCSFLSAWNSWTPVSVWDGDTAYYTLTCPEENSSIEQVQQDTLNIMAHCRQENLAASRIVLRYRYEKTYCTADKPALQDAIYMSSGIRAVSSSFLNLSHCRMRFAGGWLKEITLTLDVNNPQTTSVYAPQVTLGEGMAATRALAADIRGQAEDPREQLTLLNTFLTSHVTYAAEENGGRVHTTLGAMLDGEAMCAGFAATVNDVCYLLDIPAYQVHDLERGHIWNMVELEGRWWLLDCTYNASAPSDTQFFLQPEFDAAYHSLDCTKQAKLEGFSFVLRHGAASQPAEGENSTQ